MAMDLMSKLVAEFTGTFFLVLSVAYNVAFGTACEWAVLSIACTLMVFVYSFGAVSGANFNPSVTLTCLLEDMTKFSNTTAPYMLIQIAAGLTVGTLLKYGIITGSPFTMDIGKITMPVLLAEFYYTFMLCYVVNNVAVTRSGKQFFGLAIGFVVVAGGYGAGNISKGCFNPAIAIGLFIGASSDYGSAIGPVMAYVGVELAAAATAVGLSKVANYGLADGATPVPENIKILCACLNEFLGTFFLILTIGLNVLTKSCAPVLSIASSLMCWIFAGAEISGAHYNPAVTVALLARGSLGSNMKLLYIVAQVVGGVLAAVQYSFMVEDSIDLTAPAGLSPMFIGETLATFVLVSTVLSTTFPESGFGEFVGLAVGMCVMAFGTAIGGHVSGGSLNPAVTIGLYSGGMISGGSSTVTIVLLMVGAEILGGLLAVGVYKATHREVPGTEYKPAYQQ
jgi:aquaporin Z